MAPTTIQDLIRTQAEVLIGKTEIKGKGTFKPPMLDLVAIKQRADELNPQSQTKKDIYVLLQMIEGRIPGVSTPKSFLEMEQRMNVGACLKLTRQRADEIDAHSQTKADIYMLLMEVEKTP